MQETTYLVKNKKIITPLTIALVADLHGKPYQVVIDSLNHHRPDIIAIVGDIINHDNDPYPLKFFEHCTYIAHSFFSLGNHERCISDAQIDDIEKTGVHVLDNKWMKIGNVVIGGMTSAFVTEWRQTHQTKLRYALPEISWIDEFEKNKEFKILLDHHPENYERVTREKDIDMVLSGHAHGGQIRLFGQGLYAPHQGFFPYYTSGVYENRLIVSRGLANIKIIPRIGNPTEIVYIEVQHQEQDENI